MTDIETYCKAMTLKLQEIVLETIPKADVEIKWWYKNQPELQMGVCIYNFDFCLEELRGFEDAIEQKFEVKYRGRYSVTGTHKGIRYYNKITNPYYGE